MKIIKRFQILRRISKENGLLLDHSFYLQFCNSEKTSNFLRVKIELNRKEQISNEGTNKIT